MPQPENRPMVVAASAYIHMLEVFVLLFSAAAVWERASVVQVVWMITANMMVERFIAFLDFKQNSFLFFSTSKKVWNIGIKVYKDNSKVDKLMIVEEKP
jgi:hypothetical protein